MQRPANSREVYAEVLDSLLAAGSQGEPLQPKHLPHLGGTTLRIALPGVLVRDRFHVADINFGDGRIRYKYNVERGELQQDGRLWFVDEAGRHAASHWGCSIRRLEPHCILQTRKSFDQPVWSVFNQQDRLMLATRRRCEFMELGRKCTVLYAD